MAINTQKFLPSSKGGALAKVSGSISKISSADISQNSQKNLQVIKVKVVQIDKILKGTLASQKKELDSKKKESSSKRREKIEEKLETKPKAESGKISMPNLPRMGFLDWIKNFIGNVILGYFAVRLVDHLPKLISIAKLIGKATDFAIDIGGKLLNGLVTFIDWGYKAYDATRGFVKNLFGNAEAKQFDQLSSVLNKFLNLVIIAGMATAGAGGFGGRGGGAKPRPGVGGRPRVTTSGGGRAGGIGGRNPLRQRPKVTVGRGGNRALLSSVRPFLKRVPLPVVGALIDFGLSWALGENPGRAAFRAIGAGLLGSVGAALAGGIGLAGGPLAIAAAALGGVAGGTLGDMAGGALYDFFFGGKQSGKGRTNKLAGGGITRGGKTQGGVKRTISRGKKGKYKRKLIAKKPGQVEIKPGADVGGEDKIFGLFPNPLKAAQKAIDVMNPFKVVENAGKNLGKADYFGPILAITSKIILGQKPNQKDYENVGLGINLLLSKGIEDGRLKGGLAAAFAEGGFVDPKTLEALSNGGDISGWVARSFKEATESNAQKTLREIQDNLRLKGAEKQTQGVPTPDSTGPGGMYSGEATGAGVLKNDPEFVKAVNKLAARLGVNPAHMLGFMEIETAGTFSPSIDNGLGYVGLIQFGADARADLGVSKQQLQSMSRIQQLEWVEKYFKNVNRMVGKNVFAPGGGATAADLYTAVFLPAYVGKPDSFVFPSKFWSGNPALRDSSRPGSPIWKGHIGKLVTQRAQKYGAGNISFNKPSGLGPGMADTAYFSSEGSAGTLGGSGKFIQGNSGNSRGVHFHIGPGSQSKGTILQSQYNADARSSAAKVIDYFLKKGSSVYDGRRGTYYKSGKEVAEAQRAHTAKGSQGGIDLQVDFEKPVPFPLNVMGMQYRPNGFGVSADIVGSNSFVAHGRYDEKGKKAPQTGGLIAYEKGGLTKSGPHMAVIGEKGREFVIDADSTAAIEQTFPGFLDAINKAKYKDAINVLKNFAFYESGAEQTVIVPEIQFTNIVGDYGSGSGGLAIIGGGGEENDPFDILYQGG